MNIKEDVQYYLNLTPTTFPKDSEYETKERRRQRQDLVEEWIRDFPFKRHTKKQKINVTTPMFYYFGTRFNIQNPVKSSTVPQQTVVTEPTISDNDAPRDFSEFLILPRLKEIDIQSILQYKLLNVIELHAPRYGQFLRQKGNLEASLWQCLRNELLDICQNDKIELSKFK